VTLHPAEVRQIKLDFYNIAPRWGACSEQLGSTNIPPRWGACGPWTWNPEPWTL